MQRHLNKLFTTIFVAGARTSPWSQIHSRLREFARLHVGRDPTPSAAIIDSQSVKTQSGGVRGFDGAKKLAGRKRHILVDTQGWLLSAVVHSAALSDRAGGRLVLATARERFPRVPRIWADQGYTGELQRWAAEHYGLTVEVVYPPFRQLKRYAPDVLAEMENASGFQVLPKRWIVERTFSWLGRQRRRSQRRRASTEHLGGVDLSRGDPSPPRSPGSVLDVEPFHTLSQTPRGENS